MHLTGDCMSSLGEITRMQSIKYKDRASYSSDFKDSPFLGAFSTESLPVSLFVLFFFLLFFSFLVPEGMGHCTFIITGRQYMIGYSYDFLYRK